MMDLVAAAGVSLLLLPFIYVLPWDLARIALGLPVLLLLPGYVLLAALFLRRESLGDLERLALSLGLSLAVVPLVAFTLHFTPWGIQITSVLSGLLLWTLGMSVIAGERRRRLSSGERYEVTWESVKGWAYSLRYHTPVEIYAAFVLPFLAILGTAVWMVQQPQRGELFTEFYVTDAKGESLDLPARLRVGEPRSVRVGIINQEGKQASYTAEASLGQHQAGRLGPILLNHGEKWEAALAIAAEQAGEGEKLEFRLYRKGQTEPYRVLHIWVDVLPP